MKRTFLIALVALVFVGFNGCSNKNDWTKQIDEYNVKNAASEQSFDDDASYTLGMAFGMDLSNFLKGNRVFPNMTEVVQGYLDVILDRETRIEKDYGTINEILNAAFEAHNEKMTQTSMQEEEAFLEENSKLPGIIITESGLRYEIIEEGDGDKPTADDNVSVHYEGKLTNGDVFDSSIERGEPSTFNLNGVIKGWTEGLQLMNVGSKYRFYIPSELAYGSQWGSEKIPPYSPLIFEIELLEIIKPEIEQPETEIIE
ncbi:MAG: FKBP-type peptidyl-prolyl cis-trans isomerase [Treponema sp.]|nr:FKBP-type peptidyl-prolyl cis-trans isomerase [Treponema sp.]